MKAADVRPPVYGYAFWLMPDDQSRQTLQVMIDQLAHEMSTTAFESHTTLSWVPDADTTQLHFFQDSAKQLASQFGPIETKVTGVGTREQYFQALFLQLVPAQKLMAMNHYARGLLSRLQDAPYMPHTSLVYGDLTAPQKEHAIGKIGLSFPPSIKHTHLALVAANGFPQDWKVIATYLLEGSV